MDEELKKKIENLEKELSQIKSELAEENKYFDLFKLTNGRFLIFEHPAACEAGFYDGCFMQIRDIGKYSGKAFYLSGSYSWELKKDTDGDLVLIPTKK